MFLAGTIWFCLSFVYLQIQYTNNNISNIAPITATGIIQITSPLWVSFESEFEIVVGPVVGDVVGFEVGDVVVGLVVGLLVGDVDVGEVVGESVGLDVGLVVGDVERCPWRARGTRRAWLFRCQFLFKPGRERPTCRCAWPPPGWYPSCQTRRRLRPRSAA